MLSKFSDLKDWVTNNTKAPRFCNLDESPYGSRGLVRLAFNPALQLSVLSDIFVSAAETCLIAHEKNSAGVFILSTMINAWAIPFAQWGRHQFLKEEMSKNWVIDKRISSLGDPNATLEMKKTYSLSSRYLFGAVGVAPAWLACISGGLCMIGVLDSAFASTLSNVLPMMANVAIYYLAMPILTATLPYGIRSARIAHKLGKDWVIRTNPPEFKQKETVPQGRLALRPIRINERGLSSIRPK